MNTKDFNRCLQLIKKGDNRGMKYIFDNYYEKLFLTAQLEVNNSFIAEDIVSNVLTSIFNNAANYKYVTKPNSWMYKSLIFAIINYKKCNAKYVYAEYMDEAYATKDSKLDLKIEFRQTLEKLTKRQQDVILLHFVYGITIIETAKILKISASTVKREINSLKDELKIFINY